LRRASDGVPRSRPRRNNPRLRDRQPDHAMMPRDARPGRSRPPAAAPRPRPAEALTRMLALARGRFAYRPPIPERPGGPGRAGGAFAREGRLAVLIDAENAQPKMVADLLAEIAKYGTAHV